MPGAPPYYARVFPTLISDWRRQWGEGDFPFLLCRSPATTRQQLDGRRFETHKRRTLALRHTGMAVTLDVGTPENVHPPDKQTVAHRLALAARARSTVKYVEYSSPEFLQATSEPTRCGCGSRMPRDLRVMSRKWAI